MHAANIVQPLGLQKLNPIFYGSTGVSYYLGEYKSDFHNLDLLISVMLSLACSREDWFLGLALLPIY